MKHSLVILGLILMMAGHGQDLMKRRDSLVGTKVERLHITDFLLNTPADTNFDGKFKVIEFWATWCRPCLKAVPHLNRLKQQFAAADSLVFLSITNESPAKAATVFTRVKFETIVASDQTETSHRALGVKYLGTMGLPVTILLDDRNTIIWQGNPQKLTARLIRKLLNREKID